MSAALLIPMRGPTAISTFPLHARSPAAKRVRRRIGMVIGLDLDDHAADAIEDEGSADELGCDRMYAAREETAAEQAGHRAISTAARQRSRSIFRKSGGRFSAEN